MGRPTFPVSGMHLGDGDPGLSRGYLRGPMLLPSVCCAGILPIPKPSTCQCALPASAGSQHDCLGQDLDGSHNKNGQQVLSVSPCKALFSNSWHALLSHPIPHPQEADDEIAHLKTNKLRFGEAGLLAEGSHSPLEAELRFESPRSQPKSVFSLHGVGSRANLQETYAKDTQGPLLMGASGKQSQS